MNENNKFEHMQPVYPQYVNAHYEEEEINLVDLWIKLTQYKTTFFVTALAVLIVGLLWAFFLFQEKYTLTSGIQIGSFSFNNQIKQVETTEALQSKLENIIIPDITNQYLSNNPDAEKFKTLVNSVKSSDVVLVQHKVKKSQVDQFEQIQNLITSSVIAHHKKMIKTYQSDLYSELQEERIKLEQLKDERTLNLMLEKQQLVIETQQRNLKNLQENLNIMQRGGVDNFLQALNIDERQRVMTSDGVVIDELLKLKFDQFLLENKLRQDAVTEKVSAAKIKMVELEKEYREEINRQQLAVQKVQQKLDAFNVTAVVTQPVLSSEPTGLKRNLLVVLVLFVSIFLGLVVVVLVMFRDKIRQTLREQN